MAAGIASLLVPASALAAKESKTNIVFILADDLGWTDLGCYGSTFYQTPNIDKLAATGMKFTNGYAACPVCSPTRASIMTGKYPARIDLTNWLHGRINVPVHGLRPLMGTLNHNLTLNLNLKYGE